MFINNVKSKIWAKTTRYNGKDDVLLSGLSERENKFNWLHQRRFL